MKVKTEVIMAPKTVITYIAEDGKEFGTKYQCEEYEAKLPIKNARVIDTAISDLEDFYSEYPMILYNIQSEEDWDTLVTHVWRHRQNEKAYPGPGLYCAVREYCGDYPDEYTIYEYDNYMSRIHHYYNQYCNEMEDAYMKFNT